MAERSAIDVAKASVIAYNEKNWDAVKEAIAPTIVYDEVGTHRRLQGTDEVLNAWRGWAAAIPDSTASFDSAYASGNTVVLELTWRGKQTGPLQTPTGEIPASGREIEVRAVQVVDVADDKAQSIRQYFDMGTILQQIGAAP